MNKQLDYETVLHERENNPESEAHLKANKFHFTGQCAVILSLLEKGMVLTCHQMILRHNVGDPRRRIKDLIDAGAGIKSEFVMDDKGVKTRFKKWWIPQHSEGREGNVVFDTTKKEIIDKTPVAPTPRVKKEKIIAPPQSNLF